MDTVPTKNLSGPVDIIVYMYTITLMAIQYTIRNIPPSVDRALRRRAKITRRSFNQTVIDELSKNFPKTSARSSDRFGWLANTMTAEDAAIFDSTITELNKPDNGFWEQ